MKVVRYRFQGNNKKNMLNPTGTALNVTPDCAETGRHTWCCGASPAVVEKCLNNTRYHYRTYSSV